MIILMNEQDKKDLIQELKKWITYQYYFRRTFHIDYNWEVIRTLAKPYYRVGENHHFINGFYRDFISWVEENFPAIKRSQENREYHCGSVGPYPIKQASSFGESFLAIQNKTSQIPIGCNRAGTEFLKNLIKNPEIYLKPAKEIELEIKIFAARLEERRRDYLDDRRTD